MIYVATISLPIEADTIEEAQLVAGLAGGSITTLATGAQEGSPPAHVTLSPLADLQEIYRLNRRFGRSTDGVLAGLGLEFIR